MFDRQPAAMCKRYAKRTRVSSRRQAMRHILPLSIAAGAALLVACNAYGQPPPGAPAAAYGGRQCFYAGNISGYRRGPGDTVIVNTNSRDYYQFRTQAYCADRIDWENRIALRSRTGS